MKLVVIACLVVLTAARPQGQDVYVDVNDSPTYVADGGTLRDAGILRMESVQNEDGSFRYGFETTDPIQQDVAGQIKQIGEEFGVVMQGSYSFQTPEGQTVTITWTADENGFQAQGDAIPKDTNSATQSAAYVAAGQQQTFAQPFGQGDFIQ